MTDTGDVVAVAPGGGPPLALPRLSGRLWPAVLGGGPAGDPEQREPEAHRHQLILGLDGPVLLVLVRPLHPVLQHMEGAGPGRERYRSGPVCSAQLRLGLGFNSWTRLRSAFSILETFPLS